MQHGRVTALGSTATSGLTSAQLRDAIDATAPHALLSTSPGARVRLRSALPELDCPVLSPAGDANAGVTASATAGSDDDSDDHPPVYRLGDVDVVVATSDRALEALPELEAGGAIDPATETYVLTDALGLSVRPTELRTVREGLDAYRRAIATDDANESDTAGHCLQGDYTHLSTALPTGYYGEWDGLTVRGAAPGEIDGAPGGGSDADGPAVASLELGTDGTVATAEYRRDSLGLRAVEGVGTRRARTLREAGYADRDALAGADVATVADLDGIARSTAARLVERAAAFEAGRVRRSTDERLPGPEPIFVDVETDGLSPSVIWLIGVLDRTAEEPYRSFLATDPDDPGAALDDFCTWYAERKASTASDRPIVAYNGDSFDFPAIERLVERHCPEHRSTWADAWTFDPYAWAVRDGNAVLPGRTNRLEDVAGAIDGSETADRADDTVLSGAEVARLYRSWTADPTPENEPDWDGLAAYCEADVRALARVYDAIVAADRVAGAAGGTTSGHADDDRTGPAETTQGTLGEF